MTPITVIKRNLQGQEVWRYTGTITRRDASAIHLEAPFNGREFEFMGVTVRRGDPFVEVYYTDRWYNIFEIHGPDGTLKGWYCNIGKPAVEEAEGIISYVDLALDLWVSADGVQTVLDEDEFAALDLDADTRARAEAALAELQEMFRKKFDPGR
jgi:predicted RNA-binding protein associated with RNAse of E/G family